MIPKSTMIGFLLVSAVILGCILFLGNLLEPRAAYADTVLQSRDFTMVTAALEEDEDLLWVVNNRQARLAVYRADKKGGIAILDMIDLNRLFE